MPEDHGGSRRENHLSSPACGEYGGGDSARGNGNGTPNTTMSLADAAAHGAAADLDAQISPADPLGRIAFLSGHYGCHELAHRLVRSGVGCDPHDWLAEPIDFGKVTVWRHRPQQLPRNAGD